MNFVTKVALNGFNQNKIKLIYESNHILQYQKALLIFFFIIQFYQLIQYYKNLQNKRIYIQIKVSFIQSNLVELNLIKLVFVSYLKVYNNKFQNLHFLLLLFKCILKMSQFVMVLWEQVSKQVGRYVCHFILYLRYEFQLKLIAQLIKLSNSSFTQQPVLEETSKNSIPKEFASCLPSQYETYLYYSKSHLFPIKAIRANLFDFFQLQSLNHN
ncbi:transmembrane protein, putative (macronuclear) [Tetrahymena thermophila SB210]|uniref:Transmembrane protein, putative n=1 Tax=Tetrahymena thermophila (strain SB210) TaxID=312017 RepID=W7XHE5_TETTS|nr:transmembrane protein, putative [Tetrahymena thermophila SB210]EWS76658.1 transmembrane protein, putative [Tetrahymena thermophila SB210]|eukprot:XP_012650826.1 transmembrane protein, putative [Tetrahymena thermophila SB210]